MQAKLKYYENFSNLRKQSKTVCEAWETNHNHFAVKFAVSKHKMCEQANNESSNSPQPAF